jgi:DNA-binding LacI/PurR family transcriptional regulator
LTRIRDIAERAGVSITTVSHVLNKSRFVHPDTEKRVLEAVEVLRYQPNMLARSLRRRQTNTIGLLVSDIENPYFTEVAYAVETTAYQRGYNMILCNTDEDLAKEIRYVDVLFAKQIDGLILAPAPGDHAFLNRYLDQGERVVLVNRCIPDFPGPAVVCDDEEAMYRLATLLLEGGQRRVGAILGLEQVSTTADRLRGLRRALEQHGQSLKDAWLFDGRARQAGGYRAAQELIQMADPPCCVIAFNSVMLNGFLLGLFDLAPHLVQQIESTSFGYSPLARICQPSRHYIAQPSYQVGHVAANLLLDVLAGAAAWRAERVVLENSLVEVGTTLARYPAEGLLGRGQY